MKIEEEIKQEKFSSEFQKAVINILYTSHWLEAENTKFLKPYGISVQQYNVLRILKGQGSNAISVNNIMSRMIDKMSNASRLVEKLRQKELIERVVCEGDRRQVDVRITSKGIKLLNTLSEKMIEFDKMKSNITQKEAKALNEILDKIRG
ncbi:MAG: MarR family transcriptional regulator [Flavobacteriales bacterium]|nr:MarR family transcriptional regulator [Flavobacteriales bacterium]